VQARDDEKEPLVGQTLSGKWRVDARLGAGGMATVYAATHRNGNRVAIKLLRSTYARDPEVRARFLREGYVSNAVGHPGAVKVLDDDSSEGSVFLVMELLEGESLEARRTRLGGRLPVDEVFTVADKLLDVLAAAHQHGIVHRDIKPENVFLTNKGEVKVLDFGVAQMRRAGGDKTGVGLMLGTPDFMAPEQMGGHPDEIDGRSDLWSTGATLFTLLAGQAVHIAATFRDHIIATSTRPARSLASCAPWVPPQLVDVIDRALKLEKQDRWPDAGTMQTALRRAYSAISLARTSPSANRIPALDEDEVEDRDKTEYQERRPWLTSDPPGEGGEIVALDSSPPSAGERTLALPPPDSGPERTIALTGSTERMGRGGATEPAPPPAHPHSPPAQPAARSFGDDIGYLRTERINNIAQLAAQVTAQAAARAPQPAQPAPPQGPPLYGPRPSLPEIVPMGPTPSEIRAAEAAEAKAATTRQRLLILAIILVTAIVLAFAARLAFELRDTGTNPTPAAPAPTSANTVPAPADSVNVTPFVPVAATATAAAVAPPTSTTTAPAPPHSGTPAPE
jgi:eukaryotic-like serine/threonine-protein kinase